jgi:hypothetical protein
MVHFWNISEEVFEKHFPDDNSCLQWLSEMKWGNGFVCQSCGHQHYCDGKYPFSRRCTKCKKEESAKANTIFSSCKMSLQIVFKMMNYISHHPDISSRQLCEYFAIRQMTCWRMKKNVELIHKTGHILITK